MSSAFCVSENVGQLKSVFYRKEVFSKKLETPIFLSILEILWNISREKKCKDCFSNQSICGLKKHKNFLKTLLKNGKDVKKKQKIFRKAPSTFKKLIRRILKELLSNFTEEDKD